jgi:hypothetical protein
MVASAELLPLLAGHEPKHAPARRTDIRLGFHVTRECKILGECIPQ